MINRGLKAPFWKTNVKNTILCTTVERFCAVISQLVQHGIVFEADASTLTIVCTGGY